MAKAIKKSVEGLEEAVVEVAPVFGMELAAYRQADLATKLTAWTPGYKVLEQGRGSRTERWEPQAMAIADKFASKFTNPMINWSQYETTEGAVRTDVTEILLFEQGRARYSQNVKLVLHRTAVKHTPTNVTTTWDYKLFVYKNGMPKQEAAPVLVEHTVGALKKGLKSFKVK